MIVELALQADCRPEQGGDDQAHRDVELVSGVRRHDSVRDLDPDALVDAALGLIAGHPDVADFAGVGDVGPTVGLEIETDDLDRPDLADSGRQEIDLGPDEVRNGERLFARQDGYSDVMGREELAVYLLFDRTHELAAQPLELEVHPPGPGLHVATGDEGPVSSPDDAAQRVEGRVGSHEHQAARPVQLHLDLVARPGRVGVAELEPVDDVLTRPPGAGDGPSAAVGGPQEQAPVRGLPAAPWVED